MDSKPGYKTTEAWILFALIVLGALLSTGIVGDETLAGKVIGAVLSCAGALGYTASRTSLKNTAIAATTLLQKAKDAATGTSNPQQPSVPD